MNKQKCIALCFFAATLLSFSEASVSNLKSFKVSIGQNNYLNFKKNKEIIWNNFCFDEKLGCARFQIKNDKKEKPTFGFLKIVAINTEKKSFDDFCKSVFDAGKKVRTGFVEFINNSKNSTPQCTLLGLKDSSHFFWKDGAVVSISVSDKSDVLQIIKDAKTITNKGIK